MRSPIQLSFAQEALCRAAEGQLHGVTLGIHATVHLVGALDVARLERALTDVVQRHEILRSTVVLTDGEPRLAISALAPVALPVLELRRTAPAARDALTRQLAAPERERGFDLLNGPMFRARLIAFGDTDHRLLLAASRMVADEASVAILIEQLTLTYNADTPIDKGAPQYADIAAAERSMSKRILNRHRSYWRSSMKDTMADRVPPAAGPLTEAADEGVPVLGQIPLETATELRRATADLRISVEAALLALFTLLMSRWAAADSVIVRVTSRSGGGVGTEDVVGPVDRSLPIHSCVNRQGSFASVASMTHRELTRASVHAVVPPDWAMGGRNTPSYDSSLKQLEYSYNYPRGPERLRMGDVAVVTTCIDSWPTPALLSLHVKDEQPQLVTEWRYDSSRLSRATVAALCEQYQYLVTQATADPTGCASSYSLIPTAHAARLPDPVAFLEATRYPTVVESVRSQAATDPNRPAVRHGGRDWTYGELMGAAVGVQRGLCASGLVLGDIAVVRGRSSFGLVVSALGVWLAGGVLLFIDAALPLPRQRHMVAETNAKFMLDVRQNHTVHSLADIMVLSVDPASGACAAGDCVGDDSRPVSAVDPAYVFFTSGSTGTPKAVLGTHQGLGRFLSWQRETFAINSTDRAAQLTALTFDVVLRDMFLPLVSGGTLCIPDGSVSGDGVVSWMRSEGITVLHAVPSLAQSWLTSSTNAPVETLRHVFFAGEPLATGFVRLWQRVVAPHAVIVNLYGPTEATLANFSYVVPELLSDVHCPVGHPLPGTQGLVLTGNGQLAGIGEIGEVVIRTPFLTRGYLNAPADNAARFRANPYVSQSDDRLYYTGDLGRYRPDGALELLGRMDRQIKIRGIRIDPGEIEAALLTIAGVVGAVVVARADTTARERLIAYVVAAPGVRIAQDAMRQHLACTLPHFLVPGAIVILDRLPLSPNGKVNHADLPDPGRPPRVAHLAEPRTATEMRLACLWADVFRLDQVGIRDNFFDLGGDSLVAAQLAGRANGAFDLAAPFVHPTIEALAKHIDSQGTAAALT